MFCSFLLLGLLSVVWERALLPLWFACCFLTITSDSIEAHIFWISEISACSFSAASDFTKTRNCLVANVRVASCTPGSWAIWLSIFAAQLAQPRFSSRHVKVIPFDTTVSEHSSWSLEWLWLQWEGCAWRCSEWSWWQWLWSECLCPQQESFEWSSFCEWLGRVWYLCLCMKMPPFKT